MVLRDGGVLKMYSWAHLDMVLLVDVVLRIKKGLVGIGVMRSHRGHDGVLSVLYGS